MIHSVSLAGRRLRAPVAALALVAATLASTAAQATTPGWYQNRLVKQVVVTSNGGFNVRVEPALTGCTSQAGYGENWASVYPSHPGINRIMALMVTAQTTGKRVNLYFYDTACTINEAILNDE